MSEEKCGGCVVIGNTSIKNERLLLNDIAPKRLSGIYGLQNKLKPEKWYIGQSLDIYDRWKDYASLKCIGQPKIYYALRKYGYDNFEKIILEECLPVKTVLLEKENFWISQKDSIKNGYNLIEARMAGPRPKNVKERISNTLKNGYHPLRGKHLSEEVRAKISNSLKGNKAYWFNKHHSKQTRDKISESRTGPKNYNYGRSRTEDTKRKISEAQMGSKNHQFGKKASEETKAKMRVSHQRRKQLIFQATPQVVPQVTPTPPTP